MAKPQPRTYVVEMAPPPALAQQTHLTRSQRIDVLCVASRAVKEQVLADLEYWRASGQDPTIRVGLTDTIFPVFIMVATEATIERVRLRLDVVRVTEEPTLVLDAPPGAE